MLVVDRKKKEDSPRTERVSPTRRSIGEQSPRAQVSEQPRSGRQFDDPNLTDGDNELKQYLDPLLKQVGTQKNEGKIDPPSVLTQDAIDVVG